MKSQLDKLGRQSKITPGISKATSNGLRQQSITGRAEIKVSCISKIIFNQVCCYVEH